MSREYRMWVSVRVPTREAACAAEEVLEDCWPWRLETERLPSCIEVSGHGDGSLSGGALPEDLARDVRRRVWTALQGYAEVNVAWVCLDNQERACGDESEFARLRDSGELCRCCEDCRDPLPFGSTDDLCERCYEEDVRERENGCTVGEER